MLRQLRWTLGYSLVLALPLVFVSGLAIGHPSLAFAVTMLVLPLGRWAFGAFDGGRTIQWSEGTATALDKLPFVYVAVLVGVWVEALVFAREDHSMQDWVAMGASLWAVLLFSTCVAHELLHRRRSAESLVGAFVAGLSGYPLLAIEHAVHHARFGDTAGAEWPRIDESSWAFAVRRIARVAIDGWHGFLPTTLRRKRIIAFSTFGASWVAFAFAGGWKAALCIASVSLAVTFGVQWITYLQHWGLGDDSVPDGAQCQYAWEDDCLLQAFLTLHISFHQAHHDSQRLPYYRLGLAPLSARLPAGYVVLLVLCLVPPLWQRAMRPVLDAWKRAPQAVASPGRRLTCFALYGERR
jgi:alkane 1-monooxygenase